MLDRRVGGKGRREKRMISPFSYPQGRRGVGRGRRDTIHRFPTKKKKNKKGERQ